MGDSDEEITLILKRLRSGDRAAEDDLIPRVYPELRRLAGKYLHRERTGHTLQATALVNEVYLRLTGNNEFDWQDRSHFFAIASRLMRRILVDYARERNADKRGGGIQAITLDESVAIGDDQMELALAVDRCLTRLSALDYRQAQVVEMRFFGGLTEDEIAEALGVSSRTVKRDWTMARAWLRAELDGSKEDV